jgi:hypothetical protein
VSSFEIKGKVAPCTLFRPLTTDLQALTGDVEERLSQTSRNFSQHGRDHRFFEPLGRDAGRLDLTGLVRLLRGQGMVAVGIQGGSEYHERLAPSNLHLGVFPESRPLRAGLPSDHAAAAPVDSSAMVVDKPVRSGQQIYAKGRDLVVLAPCGPGRGGHRRRQHPHLRGAARPGSGRESWAMNARGSFARNCGRNSFPWPGCTGSARICPKDLLGAGGSDPSERASAFV